MHVGRLRLSFVKKNRFSESFIAVYQLTQLAVILLITLQYLVSQDTVLAWDNIKAKGKGKERHLFLLEKVLIGAKKTETGGNKNKDDFSYNVKFVMKVFLFKLYLLIIFIYPN